MTAGSEVRFPVDDGIELGAWLYLPKGNAQRCPAITMAHGYAGVKEHGITRFAETFANAGFVVLLHDHRTFGISGGEPRQDVDPWRQVADWRRAISYLESRPEVDSKRIGLWGTSYAGGHTLVLGATDRRIACVVSQVPTISGYQQGLRRVSPEGVEALEAVLNDDERAQARGEPPRRQAIVTADTAIPASETWKQRDGVAASDRHELNRQSPSQQTQYFAYPGYDFSRLRREAPAQYESYVDLIPGEWTAMRIEVQDATAKLFVGTAPQPVLIVNDLKRGADAHGSVGLYVDNGTDGHFRKLRVRRSS
jgi:dienelactone hydrolase